MKFFKECDAEFIQLVSTSKIFRAFLYVLIAVGIFFAINAFVHYIIA